MKYIIILLVIGAAIYAQQLYSSYKDIKYQIKFHEKFSFGPLSEEKLQQYYVYDKNYKNNRRKLNQDGIPIVVLPDGSQFENHPTAIAQYALNIFSDSIEKPAEEEKELLDTFIRLSEAILKLKVSKSDNFGNEFTAWEVPFRNPWYPFTNNRWISAMTQGQCISVLLRAYQTTGEDKYLETAKDAFKSFFIQIKDGGVLNYDDNNLYLEEVPSIPGTHILNGFIYSMWGINDYYRVTRDQKAKELVDKCLNTLKKEIKKYDLGYWSRYDHPKYCWSGAASPSYQNLHIRQLNILYNMTGDKVFTDVSSNFERELNSVCSIMVYVMMKQIYRIRRRIIGKNYKKAIN